MVSKTVLGMRVVARLSCGDADIAVRMNAAAMARRCILYDILGRALEVCLN